VKQVVLFLPLALLFIAALPAAAQPDTAKTASHTAQFDPSRDAAEDIRLAVAEAQRSGRRVLLDVGGNWCKWCTYLDAFFEADTEAARQLHAGFVVVKVNFSKENDNKDVLANYTKIPGYPHFFVLESDGTFLHSQDTGALEEGKGYDRKKIIAFITKWTKQTPQ